VPRSVALAAALAALLLAAPAAPAVEPIMPLSEVRAGMQCTARSVVQGTAISTFRADVVDVVAGSGSLFGPRILVRVSGPAIDGTGIGPGFSGTPVSCPGADGVPRVVGAISEGVGDFGGDVALATPIEAILGEPVDPPAATRTDAVAARTLARARPLAAPLSVGGLAPPLARAVVRAARRAGRAVYAAPAAPRAVLAPQTLQPGSSMAAGLMAGDLSVGAVGTVAYVDGDRVWAFGHPFEAAGRRSLFLQDAYVYAVIGNPIAAPGVETYKLAAPGNVLGTISADGLAAVAGRTGAPPPSLPFEVVARDADRGVAQTTDVRLADERAVGLPAGASPLSAVAPIVVAQAAVTALGAAPARQSGRMCVRFDLDRRRPLRFCNAYVGGGGGEDGGGPMAADFARAAALVDAFDAVPLGLRQARVGMTLRRGLHQAFLVRLRGPRTARRGRAIRMRALLRRPGGRSSWRTLRVRVPRDAKRGLRDLVLVGTPADGSSTSALEAIVDVFLEVELGGEEPERAPSTIAELRRAVARVERFTGVRARLVAPGRAPRTDGGQRGAVVLRDPAERISGVASLRLRVR
jgi:hypothetical protein